MRPSKILFVILLLILLIDITLYIHAGLAAAGLKDTRAVQAAAVAGLGLADLAVATEARYTRHPAVSDPMAPFMDHPGALEHFPTGSFWSAPQPGFISWSKRP